MVTAVKQDIKEIIKGKVLYDEPMKRHTSFRIGGPADIWIQPQDFNDLKNCIQLCEDGNIPLLIYGSGTNLLVKDEGIRGVVVNMSAPLLRKIYWGERRISVTSSLLTRDLLNFCSDKGLGGIEFLSGIPGTVGGAVATNAGARHYEDRERWLSVGDLIEDVKIIDRRGETSLLGKKELPFGYKSIQFADSVILEVKFLLKKSSRDRVLKECRRFIKRKKAMQESGAPSAGCVFKNPPHFDKSAGALIDECNLKGLKIGGAQVSRRHANFIVNRGNARSRDVIALIDAVKDKVKAKFGIELSLEIRIV